ncbi:LuxR family transcriptional regulator [Flagellimonas nanhaiensis]|uniref:LuxR family transcriptional regulator n=1 Tax=Flagellimonas nanhaiensis TaxID=2292706 RepID=A0A371JTL3_9FLAO|nr:LuxR family transcriptional regulator [Allomuricauda nanhaiensis]
MSQELPPIQNFTPTDYNSESQNWAISQTPDKIIYVANNTGLLEFDGSRWTLHPSPNESIIRSVKVVDNRIYTGCYMEFGFWEKGNLGVLTYHSLSDSIKEDLLKDEEFWGILDMGQWMVFQSHNRIYTYNITDGTINNINSDVFVPKVFKIGRTVFFQKMGQGIFQIRNGEEFLVYDDEMVRNDEIINIFEKEQEILILTRNNGFFRTNNGSIEKWDTGVDSLLSEISLYSALELKNGNYALGTISHGLILMDNNGSLLTTLDQGSELQNNTVLSLFEDIDNNIWLGLDVGISYVNVGSPFHVYPDSGGLVGGVYASAIFEKNLYLGTNQGLYFKELGGDREFSFIEGTGGQVWSLTVLDGNLFCGHHTGTFRVINDKVEKIADVQGTWTVGKIDDMPNLLLQGNYDGLYVLEFLNGAWRLKNKINGFDHSARYFELYGDNIFVNHEYKGVFKIEVNKDLSEAIEVKNDTVIRGSNSGIIKYKDNLLYAYKKGVFKYDSGKNAFIKDSLMSTLYTEEEYVSGKMIVDSRQRLWLFSNSNINFVSDGGLANTPIISRIPLTEDMRNGIIGYESVTPMQEEGRYLIGARSGYFTVDTDNFGINDFNVGIRTVKKADRNQSVSENNLLDSHQKGDFKSEENSFEIAYNVPYYNKYLRPLYQYQLIGIYPNWSKWSEEPFVSFENLPPGDYTFNVRAKIGDKVSNNVASYEFKIAKPWYRSNLFLILYVIGAILGSIAIHGSYRQYYHKRQQKLIEENQREMALAKAQNEKEIIRIKNEQLQEEFRSKSNELAASTMSIIKKNELLSSIKQQLISSEEDKNTVKPIIEIIDKSLDRNDDWEFFKEAFNNADRKFLKKLKKAHPELSPNDIKLCAYLRLNLSSKEIAPMFNISPRSVEIKRYRLRKKMNLTQDDNLVDYILKL